MRLIPVLACLLVLGVGVAGAQLDDEAMASMKLTQANGAFQAKQYGAAAGLALEVTRMPGAQGELLARAHLLRGMALLKLDRMRDAKASLRAAVATPGASRKVRDFVAQTLDLLKESDD